MSETLVIHCKFGGGYLAGEYVYIGRGSKWGNPHPVDAPCAICDCRHTREEAIDLYRQHLLASPELLAALGEVRGKVLGCWCKPQDCHGDVIAELADGGVPTQ